MLFHQTLPSPSTTLEFQCRISNFDEIFVIGAFLQPSKMVYWGLGRCDTTPKILTLDSVLLPYLQSKVETIFFSLWCAPLSSAAHTQPLICNHFSRKMQKSGSRKVVLQTRIFFLVNHFSRTRKNVDLWYKTTFFSGQPLFSNQIS